MEMHLHSYWTIDKQYSQEVKMPDALGIFESLFSLSVQRRLRSDVPVGSSLSGGLDSSTIAYFVNRLATKKGAPDFTTFSAVFPGFEKNESEHIKTVTGKFNLKNYTVTPTADELIKEFERVSYHQEEPFTSSSIFAQYKVYQMAGEHGVKVLLDGQGADETMAGYHKYIHWYLQELVSRYRFTAAKKEMGILRSNKTEFQWGVKNIIAALLPSHVAIALEKKEYNHIMHQPDISKNMLMHLRGREWEGIHKPIVTKLNDILYFNTMELGLEELLRYADRNSMAHGVEVRLPFLNAELVKFIFSLSSRYKVNDGFTKSLLRKMMTNKLPSDIVWRTDKVGFEPPQKQWMQQPVFKDYLHEAKKKLVKEKILKESVLNKKVTPSNAHEVDNFDWRYLSLAHIMG